ncbi:MAG: 4-amino-4-deoxy-L-arabinose transferase-like glycosyltransferase [Candidatus Azotimanducaceae bacterium]
MTAFLRQHPAWVVFIVVLLAARLFWSSHLPLMDFSEARYAEMARKILDYQDWISLWFTADQPFWGKPPAAFWSVAVSFAALGVNEFAARLPSLIFTLITALLIYRWIKVERDASTALIATTIYLSIWLVVHTAGAVITDPLLALSTTMVMIGFWRGVVHAERNFTWLMWAGLGIGLMSKGPVALVLCGFACGFWVVVSNEWQRWWRHTYLVRGVLLMLVIALPWYVLAELKTPGFIDYFIVGEHFLRFTETAWSGDLYGGVKDQPHGTIWLYLMVALLPFSPIVFFRLLSNRGRLALKDSFKKDRLLLIYLLAWFFTPLVFFTIAQNILITYVLTAMPAAAILIAIHLEHWLLPKRWFYHFVIGSTLTFFVVYSIAYERYIRDHPYNQKPLVVSYLALNELDPGPLIYWGGYRFSVVFYTHDDVLFPGPKVAEHLYDTTVYHAVRDMWAPAMDLPPFVNRCEKVFYHGEYTLLYCPAIATTEPSKL